MTTLTPRVSYSLWGSMRTFFDRGGFQTPNPIRPVGNSYYVDGSNTTGLASDEASGRSWDQPFLTMARAFEVVTDFDTIYVMGVIKEQLISPVGVFDVTIIGAGNRPRQATSGGVATGGGATWLAPASPTATTALLKLIEQGWSVYNIQFVPHTSSSCITIERAEASGSIAEIDGSHATIVGNRFVGGTTANGILFLNGGYNCVIEGNEFETLTGTAILSSGTSVSIPRNNRITNNRFSGCTNAIAISSTDGLITDNIFRQAADDANNKINLVSVSGQGATNMVLNNYLSDVAANVTIAKGYKPGTTDVWRNFGTDAADAIIAVPI